MKTEESSKLREKLKPILSSYKSVLDDYKIIIENLNDNRTLKKGMRLAIKDLRNQIKEAEQ